ncbi:MAG TPA: hypothetical protein VLA15_09575, partial [Desulfurivibrionaceae bacterium]|nr:hypothetical protein [Desulfurivibrionaceae bacterium]
GGGVAGIIISIPVGFFSNRSQYPVVSGNFAESRSQFSAGYSFLYQVMAPGGNVLFVYLFEIWL